MYDVSRRTGALYNAITYRRRYHRRSSIQPSTVDISMEEKEELLKFLKTCVLPKDREDLEDILTKYKEYRRNLIVEDVEEYLEICKFYFVCPDLVNFCI